MVISAVPATDGGREQKWEKEGSGALALSFMALGGGERDLPSFPLLSGTKIDSVAKDRCALRASKRKKQTEKRTFLP